MNLLIDGMKRTFTPMREYCVLHELPPEFGVALFEPKKDAGLGSIESSEAGVALKELRAAVLVAIPQQIALAPLVSAAENLTTVFRAQMYAINAIVRLKPVEIEFAAAGFADVTQNYAYALLRARLSAGEPASFWEIYGEWLESSARVATSVHQYVHRGTLWHVQVVTHAYGRAGLAVDRGEPVDYVADGALACPADGFMAGLLREVCGGMSTPPA